MNKTIDVEELTRLIGLPAAEQEAVFSWTGELDRGHRWTAAEADELVHQWRLTAKRTNAGPRL